MSYINTLSEKQKENVSILLDTLKEYGITNPFAQAAICAIVSKESNFDYKFEKGYGGTDASRIRKVFKSRVSHLSDAEIDKIKKDPVAFFNLIYGGRNGNQPSEGYKYRGGGPNQLTFHDNYKATGDRIGVDLVRFPEKVNDPEVAAKVAADYFVHRFKRSYSTRHQIKYNSQSINDFKTLNDACYAMYHANAGFGRTFDYIENKMLSGGGKKTLDRAPEFLNTYLNTFEVAPFETKEEGDKFRNWVNDNYPEIAKEIQLDRSGSHTNSYILSAYRMVGGKYQK